MADASTKKGLVRAASLMGMFTIVSRLLGLVREMVRAHFLGTSLLADAFTIAFMIPNLFRRLVGEGAMTAASVPVMIDERKSGGKRRLNEVANAFITLFSFILTALCLFFVATAGWFVENVFARGFADDPIKLALTVELTQYMFFYLLFIGLAAICQAVLNSFKIFGPSSFTPILLNISVIASAMLLGDVLSNPTYSFAIGVMIGGALQLLFQIPYVRKAGVSLKPSFAWSDPAVKKILRLMAPGLLGAGVYQINVLLSQMIATYLTDGAVSSLQYSARLTEFTLGVFVVAIGTAVLPTLSNFVSDERMDEFRSTVEFALRLIAYVTIPAMLGLLLIRYPLINVLFRSGRFDQSSVDLTATAFVFHIIGLYFIGMERVLVPSFFSLKDMVTPVKAAIVATIVNVSCCLLLAGPLEQGGIALANSISALAQTAVLLVFMYRKVGALNWYVLIASLGRIVLCGAVMFGSGYWLVSLIGLETEITRIRIIPGLAAVVICCALIYAGMSYLLRCPEFRELLSVIRRRKN